jgi:predicted nuclease with TOPRIM domain
METEHRLTQLEERSKSNSHRIDELEKRQYDLEELTGTVKVLAVREQNVENDVKEIKNDVKALTNKPAKKWENLSEKVILTIASAVVGFILAKFGIGG